MNGRCTVCGEWDIDDGHEYQDKRMKPGDEVIVSDFDGDIGTIGVRAIFVRMSADGKFLTRPSEPRRYKKELVEWRYCEPVRDND